MAQVITRTQPTANGHAPEERDGYRLPPQEIEKQLGVDSSRGLSAEEAKVRLETYGPNQLAEKAKEPGWRAFLRQYEDLMQIVLVVAAVVNQIVTGETGT